MNFFERNIDEQGAEYLVERDGTVFLGYYIHKSGVAEVGRFFGDLGALRSEGDVKKITEDDVPRDMMQEFREVCDFWS